MYTSVGDRGNVSDFLRRSSRRNRGCDQQMRRGSPAVSAHQDTLVPDLGSAARHMTEIIPAAIRTNEYAGHRGYLVEAV